MAYRTNLPIADILTEKNGVISKEKNLFFAKEEMLTTSPLSSLDFRKIILDNVAEVHNVWIEPISTSGINNYIKGVFRIVVQVNDETAFNLIKAAGTTSDQKYANQLLTK